MKICARVDRKQVVVEITRDILAIEISDLIARTEEVVDEAIANGKVNSAEIAHVLPIGGSSRLVPFQDAQADVWAPPHSWGRRHP